MGDVPAVAELPVLPEVAGDDPEFDPEFDPEDPEDPAVVPADPGRVPHGEPLGLVPGVFDVFGFIVEG